MSLSIGGRPRRNRRRGDQQRRRRGERHRTGSRDHPFRGSADLRHDPEGRHARYLPDREPRADGDAAADKAADVLRSRHRGRDRPSRSYSGRVTTLGELTASIAHEVNQPLTGAVGSSTACLRWLDKDPPRLDEVRTSVEAIIHDCNRASEIVARIRALANKTDTKMDPLDINSVVAESVELVSRELNNHGATLHRN